MADSKSKDVKKDDKEAGKEAGGDTERGEPKRSRIAELLFLDDDDDFEEFPVEDWSQADEEKEDEKAAAWSENWDDDELDDEFSKKLQAELEKLKTTKPQASSAPQSMSH